MKLRSLQSIHALLLTQAVIVQKYDHLFKVNTETSHYLLSKVYRAREALEKDQLKEASASQSYQQHEEQQGEQKPPA
jgi:phage/plasmid primase-like uncharacterized protein